MYQLPLVVGIKVFRSQLYKNMDVQVRIVESSIPIHPYIYLYIGIYSLIYTFPMLYLTLSAKPHNYVGITRKLNGFGLGGCHPVQIR